VFSIFYTTMCTSPDPGAGLSRRVVIRAAGPPLQSRTVRLLLLRIGAAHATDSTQRRGAWGQGESEDHADSPAPDVCQDTCPVPRSPEHLGPILAAVPVSAQEDMEDETNIAARKPEGRSNLCGAMRRLHPMAR